jgi:hypothetical protein
MQEMDAAASENARDYRLISVSGLYGTGSSALFDLIREYDQVHAIRGSEFKPFECGLDFIIPALVCGATLKGSELARAKRAALAFGASPSAFRSRFERFLKPWWPWVQISDFRRYGRVFPAYSQATGDLFKALEQLLYGAPNDRGKALANTLSLYFAALFHSAGIPCGKAVLVDQLVKPVSCELASVLPEARILYVTRDPRDQFCDMLRRPKLKARFQGPRRCEAFVELYTERLRTADAFRGAGLQNVLHVQFEQLVLSYSETKAIVEKFLGLERHVHPLRFFNPEEAKSKVEIFRHHHKPEEIEWISTKLSPWLFEF